MKRLVGAAFAAALFFSPVLVRAEPSRLAGEIDAQGLRQVLGRHKGQALLVNFWATWCEPCREEYPSLIRLQRALGPRGLQIIGISTDLSSAMPGVEKFLAQQKPSFPNYRKKSGGDDQDFIDAVDQGWGGELPFSVLYDRNGRKVKTLSGKHSYAQFEREVLAILK